MPNSDIKQDTNIINLIKKASKNITFTFDEKKKINLIHDKLKKFLDNNALDFNFDYSLEYFLFYICQAISKIDNIDNIDLFLSKIFSTNEEYVHYKDLDNDKYEEYKEKSIDKYYEYENLLNNSNFINGFDHVKNKEELILSVDLNIKKYEIIYNLDFIFKNLNKILHTNFIQIINNCDINKLKNNSEKLIRDLIPQLYNSKDNFDEQNKLLSKFQDNLKQDSKLTLNNIEKKQPSQPSILNK